MDRRSFLTLSGATLMGAALSGTAGVFAASGKAPHDLKIQTARYKFLDGFTENMVSLSKDAPPPVIRMRQGEPFAANVTNTLAEATAMHWHGIRLPNKMDGVPYLTQWPIQQGETWHYAYTSKDAGTYWYHPHCMTMDQIARGLTGVLIVDERRDPDFDAETILNLRDFRIGEDGQFLAFSSPRRASRAGTLGTVMTANWEQNPVYRHPPGAIVRLRVAATDTTRIYRLALQGGAGRVLAADGHPLRAPLSWPSPERPIVLAPGQRLDIALLMPADEAQDVVLTHMAASGAKPLATFRSNGTPVKRTLGDIPDLPANEVPDADPASAKIIELVFGWSPDGLKPNNGICGTLGYTFWSINRKPWPGDAVEGIRPVAELRLGQSYVLRMRNESPNAHPIHLHGLVFRPIRSNKLKRASNWTDTIVLTKNETADVLLVADNPGDWAFHCHVIEHQKTGLAGYIRVT
ncbi:MAG: multicopper oxidase family protein [Hyphomicrobiaceae bacterium]|nr:multicopper oxidase family protein [Hyphomicrobiaceae bacterium]